MEKPQKGNWTSWDILNYIGAFLAILGIVSSLILIIAGIYTLSIESVAGDTIMEAYYHGMGIAMIGFGLFTGPLLIAIGFKIQKSI